MPRKPAAETASPALPRLVQYAAHPTSPPVRVHDAHPVTDTPGTPATED